MVITLAGAICIPRLPIALFPEITPPTVQVKATYTGAPADVVEATVTTPLEEQINGVQGMIYMSSVSANDGSSVIVVSFDVGYDLDIAAVDVQNRAQIAQPQLPSEVQRQGVTVKKQSTDLTLVVNLGSPDGSRDELYLSNYATINIIDVLEAHPRRRRRGELRRRGLLDAHLARPRPARQPGAGRHGRGQCRPRAERPGRLRPDRPAPRAEGPAVPVPDHHPRPARHRPGVRGHHRPHEARRLRRAHPGRRPGGPRRADLQ